MILQPTSTAKSDESKPRGFEARLAAALPEGMEFFLHHISTPPTACPPIFAPPPGSPPEKTYCESHFLTVSIDSDSSGNSTGGGENWGKHLLLVFAIEVLIYTTSNLTTLFVSKADSTGYLHSLKGRLRSPSPLKVISTTFLSHLVDTRQRPGVKLVVSLFARSQGQYLFPGSIHNGDKHVMDDRGLVRWWCGVLDPMLKESPANGDCKASSGQEGTDSGGRIAKGYLVVPGYERRETFSLLPPLVKADPSYDERWVSGHPLLQISSNPNAPPKCLIPHFPDDPKSRFIDQLDGEDARPDNARLRRLHSDIGLWRTVRSLDHFWEMMAFRQECSAGRIVGFIWVVFDPTQGPAEGKLPQATNASDGITDEKADLSLRQSQAEGLPDATQGPGSPHAENNERLPANPPPGLPANESSKNPFTTPPSKPSKSKVISRTLSGPIFTRQPRIKPSISSSAPSHQPSHTPFYTWPPDSRGQVVLDEKNYTRVNELLLRLEFSTEWLAKRSTKKYVEEVSVIAGLEGKQRDWGIVVTGQKSTNIHILAASPTSTSSDAVSASSVRVDILSSNLVRKRLPGNEIPTINLLGSGLVRKKPKS